MKNVEENVLEMSDSDAQNRPRIEMVVGKINEKIEHNDDGLYYYLKHTT